MLRLAWIHLLGAALVLGLAACSADGLVDFDDDGIPDGDDCDSQNHEGCITCQDLPSAAVAEPLCGGACPAGFSIAGRLHTSSINPNGITSDGDRLLVTDNGREAVYTVNVNNGATSRLFYTPSGSPTGTVMSANGLYVADFGRGDVDLLNVTTGAVISTIDDVGTSVRDVAIRSGDLWAVIRDDASLRRINPTTEEEVDRWSLGLGSPSALAFCSGFPLVADRDGETLHVFDTGAGRKLYRQSLDADDLYGLTCRGGQPWITDPVGQDILKLTAPIRDRHLGAESARAGDDIPGLEREPCSPYELWDVDAPAGTTVQTMVAYIDMPVAVIVWDGDDPVWYAEVPREGVLPVPALNVTANSDWTIEVTALRSRAEGRYGLWATSPTFGDAKHISGTVYGDDVPLPGAEVAVENTTSYIGTLSDGDGHYALTIPRATTPDIVLVTATHPGYSADIEPVDTRTGDEIVDFYLYSESPNLIAVSDALIHLGDNNYSGSINSQFQTPAIGFTAQITFQVSDENLSYDTARLSMLVKGAQHRNKLFINDVEVGQMVDSPSDGGYGSQSWEFWRGVLVPGRNVLRVESVVDPGNTSDHDDFEFSEVRISLGEVDAWAFITSWNIPSSPAPLGLTWVGDTLYYVGGNNGDLWTFDPATGVARSTGRSLGHLVTGMDAIDDTTVWAALPNEGRLAIFDVTTGAELSTIPAPGPYPRDVGVEGNVLWVTDRDEDTAYRMRLDGTVLNSWPLDQGDPSGAEGTASAFWTTDRSSGTVRVLNLVAGAVIREISGIPDPYAVDLKDGYGWVLDRDGRAIHWIDGGP